MTGPTSRFTCGHCDVGHIVRHAGTVKPQQSAAIDFVDLFAAHSKAFRPGPRVIWRKECSQRESPSDFLFAIGFRQLGPSGEATFIRIWTCLPHLSASRPIKGELEMVEPSLNRGMALILPGF